MVAPIISGCVVIGVVLIVYGIKSDIMWLLIMGSGLLGGAIGYMYNDLLDKNKGKNNNSNNWENET